MGGSEPVIAQPAIRRRMTAILFDLDGTLVDSAPGIGAALAAAFATIGRHVAPGDLRRLIGPPIRVMARRLCPELSAQEAADVEAAYRPLYDDGLWSQTTLFPAVALTLKTLRGAGCRLFVATNKPQRPAIRILEHLGLRGLFEEIVTRDSVAPPYANKAAMVGGVVQRHGLDAATAVMVGDTAEDGEAAAANGIGFVWMTHGYGECPGADLVCDDFPALLTWVRG